MKQQNNALQDECKEAQMKLMQTKQQMNQLKKKTIDPSRFMQWTSDEFVDWIGNLEQERYKVYEQNLRQSFLKEGISGEAIPHIEKSEWKEWGVTNYMDRTKIHQHVGNLVMKYGNQQMVNNNNNQLAADPNMMEGVDGTAYV